MTVENKTARVAIKVLLVLIATALTSGCFGLAAPITLLALGVLPNWGMGSVIYFMVGGAIGLIFGLVSATVSLRRSDALVTPYCAKLILTCSVFFVFYLACQMHIESFHV